MILGLQARAAKAPAGRRLGSNGRPNFAQQIGYRLLAADKQARGRLPIKWPSCSVIDLGRDPRNEA
jgi:hypothetical protein